MRGGLRRARKFKKPTMTTALSPAQAVRKPTAPKAGAQFAPVQGSAQKRSSRSKFPMWWN